MMIKTGVIFFSPTGNGKRVAEIIAAYHNADFTEMKNVSDLTTANCELLYLVFPVYGQRAPKKILAWIEQLRYKKSVAVCAVYGSVHPGKALYQAAKMFEKIGAEVIGGAEIPSNHVYFDKLSNKIDLLPEKENITTLCKEVSKRMGIGWNTVKFPYRYNILSLLFPKLRTQIGIKKPKHNRNCNACNTCVTVCPHEAIGKDLHITRKCFRCGACVKNCSQKARKLEPGVIMEGYLKKYCKPKEMKIY